MPVPIRDLVAEYRKRLVHFGGVKLIEIAEARRTANSPAQRQQGLLMEAKRLRECIPCPALTLPLDASGRNLSSVQLAEVLDHWRHHSETVCFVIGGPDGLHSEIVKTAPWSLSLGAMTFPHMLARVILLEQIYRAHTILQKIPYHR